VNDFIDDLKKYAKDAYKENGLKSSCDHKVTGLDNFSLI